MNRCWSGSAVVWTGSRRRSSSPTWRRTGKVEGFSRWASSLRNADTITVSISLDENLFAGGVRIADVPGLIDEVQAMVDERQVKGPQRNPEGAIIHWIAQIMRHDAPEATHAKLIGAVLWVAANSPDAAGEKARTLMRRHGSSVSLEIASRDGMFDIGLWLDGPCE
jgi:hypothetical protein